MKIRLSPNCSGIAMIIVMIVIVVLGVMAGGLAYSMKVETRLAQNGSFDSELEWMGRSGVELARYVISQGAALPQEPWDSLNQKWAGGPKGTNEALAAISLVNQELGRGMFSVKITDTERKFNVNVINESILQQALIAVGLEPSESMPIVNAFMDWRDPDDNPRMTGAESADYIATPNPGFAPYIAKNGPMDDISELRLIRGITEEMYWGPMGQQRANQAFLSPSFDSPGMMSESAGASGLVDFFTPISFGTININTASAAVLQLIPGVDSALAQGIIRTRAGLDGADGTEDDIPFRSPGELINVPGMHPQFISGVQGFLGVRSYTFEVTVETRIGGLKRQFVALLRRNAAAPRDVQIQYFHWK